MRAWLALLFCFSLWSHRAEARLEPPPDSFLLVSPDQTRCLVMGNPRVTNYWGADLGRFAILPDGRRLDLYTQFPSNGVYQLPDLKPVYFLDWFDGSNAVAVSSDFKSVLHYRDWAVDTYRVASGRQMPKAMEFYHDGKMIRSYVASELVENPGKGGPFHTVPLPEYDYWAPWMTVCNRVGSSEVEVVTASRGLYLGRYGITLSPGNRFVFNLATGQILSAEHPLQMRARVMSAVLLCLILLTAGWFLSRKRPAS
jgi:hypothetical protein